MDTGGTPIDRCVGFSHEAVGSAAANYLADLGRRNIAYAGKQVEIDGRSIQRIRGFQTALAARGLPAGQIQSLNEASSIGLGRQLLSGVLEKYPKTDAIFFGNDDLAAGALFECQRRSVKVPERIAILGFNDLEIASEVTPAISSIATPRREIGVSPESFSSRKWRNVPHPESAPSISDSTWSSEQARRQLYETNQCTDKLLERK